MRISCEWYRTHFNDLLHSNLSNRIFLIFFINSFGQQISGALLAYVTSDFAEHSLIPVTQVVSQLVAGVIKLPVAKLMDVWGRPQGFVLMLFCAVIGRSEYIMPSNM